MRLKWSGRPDPPCCPAALPCPSNPPSPAPGLQTEEAKQKQTLQKQDDKQAKNKRNTVMKSHQKKVGSGLKANTPCFVCGISSDLGFSVQIFALANVFFFLEIFGFGCINDFSGIGFYKRRARMVCLSFRDGPPCMRK